MTQRVERMRREWEQAIAEMREQGVNLLDPNEWGPLKRLHERHELSGFDFDVEPTTGRIIRLCVYGTFGAGIFQIPIDERLEDPSISRCRTERYEREE